MRDRRASISLAFFLGALKLASLKERRAKVTANVPEGERRGILKIADEGFGKFADRLLPEELVDIANLA